MTRLRPVFALCTLFSLACSAADDGSQPSGAETPVTGGAHSTGGAPSSEAPATGGVGEPPSAGASGAGMSGAGSTPPGRTRCAAPAGLGASPGTIEEAVQWLNALPKPTTAACFLESLPRPLAVVATNSQFSAQPALNNASPRLFIELGRLWVSAVIDGPASYLLEFGYRLPEDELSSIKGELELPLDDVIALNAPYEKVRYRSGTTCGFCHGSERVVAGLSPDAFVSNALRPRPESRVSVDSLRAEHQACNWLDDTHRCEMLSAVFDGGVVNETAFPVTMPTFF